MTSRSSSSILILVNLIPIAGVTLFQWKVIDILLVYATESAIIGVINVMRMIKCRRNNLGAGLASRLLIPANVAAKIAPLAYMALKGALIGLFVLNYGLFCLVHLFGVTLLFGETEIQGISGNPLHYLTQSRYWIVTTAIAVSHLYSYFSNFVGKNEYQNANLILLFKRPFGRIVAMQIAIIASAFLVDWAGSPMPMLIVLVFLKTLIDLRMHQKERMALAVPALQATNPKAFANPRHILSDGTINPP